MSQHARLTRATSGLPAPVAVVDLDAFDVNAAALVERAAGKPIRLASKSVRSRTLIGRALAIDGFAGVLAFTLPEALWLARSGIDDVVVGYPSADRVGLAELAGSEDLTRRVTLMIDSAEQLDFIDSVLTGDARPALRVCIDIDASLRMAGGRVHLGVRRSPVHESAAAAALARLVVSRPGFTLVGLMSYEAQIAGQADRPLGKAWQAPVVRTIKQLSWRDLGTRRSEMVAAVRQVAELEFVNAGGTGSLEATSADPSVTELTAGSGLFAPALFDGYDSFDPVPAAFFGLDVVRRPGPGLVTVLGGGWAASGAAGRSRLPVPTYPAGLSLLGIEGAGEVQTPLTGAAADDLQIGDRVWFRHAKAGELCEHVDELRLLAGEAVIGTVSTYRGEGKAFL